MGFISSNAIRTVVRSNSAAAAGFSCAPPGGSAGADVVYKVTPSSSGKLWAIVGYDDTVVPQLINALLSRHNFILLGLRGQAKTRLLRALVTLLDEQIPVECYAAVAVVLAWAFRLRGVVPDGLK